jgi:hypothetical protein
MGFYSATKNKITSQFAGKWMKLEIIISSKYVETRFLKNDMKVEGREEEETMRGKEREKKDNRDKYDQNTLCTCMRMLQCNL